MEKSLPDLILELDELNRKIRRARLQEFKATNRAAQSQRVPTAIRRQVQLALDELPGRAGLTLPEYRNRAFQGICDVAQAWGGACLSKEYEGHTEPLEFVCAAGHRFSMLAHGLRLGHWCRECSYGRATVYSLDDARTIAIKRGGRCLSRRYGNSREKMRWRCKAGHTWSASLEQVLRGDWCQTCHFERIRPRQEDIERAAIERGGKCLSTYVDKETPLRRQCADGHTWCAPWFRVSNGQWCHQCAVKARTRTIEQMRELAQSRGGRCLSTVYPGAHGKIEWECASGHVWSASVNSVWRGSWCPECAWASRRMARRRKQGKNLVPIVV